MTSARKIAPYGTWTSPITPSVACAGVVTFAELMVNPKTNDVYVVENRPAEDGRGVIVRVNGEASVDVLPKEFNVRAKIHTYGGGAASMYPDGRIIFTDANSAGVFFLSPDGDVEEILTGSEASKIYYGDFNSSPAHPGLILAIQELHREDGEVVNTIAAIDIKTRTSKVIVEGADFYSHPKFSPDGKNISWMQWDHPNMPWTGSQAYVADWAEGKVINAVHVAGKSLTSSVCQPRWSPDGALWFVDEPEGIWQVYRYPLASKTVEYVHIKGYEKVEMGKAEWFLGTSTYGFLDQNTLVIANTKAGVTGIITYDIATDFVTELPLDLIHVEFNGIQCISPTSFVVTGGTTKSPSAVYLVDITKPEEKQVLKSSATIDIPVEILSPAQAITFPRTHGNDLSRPSHTIFVPPHNPSYEAPTGSLPPLIIHIHGGPTAHVPLTLSLEAQYFTSRGYAYTCVNYAGSTGFGRAYRDDLNYSWGIREIEDTLSCIDYLASQNLIDRNHVAIRGGSSGGYTVLQALVTHPRAFAAGCSLFGVGNLKRLVEMTHKFESRYVLNLLFPSDTSEKRKEEIYRERSPCFHAEKIETPVVLFQGSEDPVVPLQQAVEMEKVMNEGGKDVTLIIFEGEGHGFKKEENLKRRIEDEESLYKRTLIA
ncbi:uncharacterized protein GIQ15_04654 [Arthroderma uncinatum]|uniref:uncharacterized protein n=1 Tax=Arthroderma uncinatum TaxID=74035 RepID=UPI00144A7DF6|nr:uncharacterized protein GIQ15_04654 [Arthroderma uncinatum]KAF3481895.1 hypothetical protein GIQ15_04654 [Arthroderma uncinatum]